MWRVVFAKVVFERLMRLLPGVAWIMGENYRYINNWSGASKTLPGKRVNLKKARFYWVLAFIPLLFISSFAQEAPPNRIISLAPNITEIIYRIGASDKLVGRTEYCLYPMAAASVPVVGGYLNPDFEQMVALKPDAVLLLPNPDMVKKLAQLGLKPFTVPNETIADILTGIEKVGRLLGKDSAAVTVVKGIQDTLDYVQSHQENAETFSALLVVGRQAGSLKGLYAAGQETYFTEILALCGGKNAFADVNSRYFDVSKEDLVLRNPDAILEFRIMNKMEAEENRSKLAADWAQLPVLKAVQSEHIYLLTERFFMIPGPRIGQVAMAFHQLFNVAQK